MFHLVGTVEDERDGVATSSETQEGLNTGYHRYLSIRSCANLFSESYLIDFMAKYKVF